MGMGVVSGFEKKKEKVRKHTNRLPLPKENQILFSLVHGPLSMRKRLLKVTP